MNTDEVLGSLVKLFQEELGANLLGVYLHGSLAMGCFNPRSSDIDLLVVVRKPLSRETGRALALRTIGLHDAMANAGGVEYSVVCERHLMPFRYPTPFELHYSAYHREKYLADESYLCGGLEDEDLAAHYAVAYHRGVALYGRPLAELYEPVDRRHYVSSIFHDVRHARGDIAGNPVYVALNLCRVLLYLREGTIASKREGGEWGAAVLPERYREVVRRCLDVYNGDGAGADELEGQALEALAEHMLREIDRSM